MCHIRCQNQAFAKSIATTKNTHNLSMYKKIYDEL